MKIDKERRGVCFNEEAHVYFKKGDEGKRYISVTTLVGKFEKPFDGEFWSAYKAIERLIERKYWRGLKAEILSSRKIDDETIEKSHIKKEDFEEKKEEILKSWQKDNENSKTRGTRIHAELENYFYENRERVKLEKYGIGGEFKCRGGELTEEVAVYPEFLMYYSDEEGKVSIAGQIDLLVVDGSEFTIVDWKTNKRIDEKSYFDPKARKSEKLRYPLNNLDDCNYSIYNMQLSTYAYMVEKMYPELKCKSLKLIHFDHEGNMKRYEMKYLKMEVEKMLSWWKKESALEERRERRKRIEY